MATRVLDDVPPQARKADRRGQARPWAGLHSSRITYRFDIPVFDVMFQWMLGAQTIGGSEIGESFYAASMVEDGDPASCIDAFTALGRRVEWRAKGLLDRGHVVSARDAYLRAYSYYRAPLASASLRPATCPPAGEAPVFFRGGREWGG